jgi:hypothetical protein
MASKKKINLSNENDASKITRSSDVEVYFFDQLKNKHYREVCEVIELHNQNNIDVKNSDGVEFKNVLSKTCLSVYAENQTYFV